MTMKTKTEQNNFFKITKNIITKEEPVNIEWIENYISNELWRSIISFFRDSYEKHKSEAMIRLYYNKVTNEWAAWAYPQTTRGMTVDEDMNSKERELQGQQFGNDWIPMGSIHHHCSSSAFQSGTDHKDEIDFPGLHITIGHIDKEEIDVHVRFSYKGLMYNDLDIEDFVEGDNIEGIPDRYKDLILKTSIYSPEKHAYPPIWLENVRKPVYNKSSFYGYNKKKIQNMKEEFSSSDFDDIKMEDFLDDLSKEQGSYRLKTLVAKQLLTKYDLKEEEVDAYLDYIEEEEMKNYLQGD